MQRVHGAFVGDDEIARVVKFWEAQRPQRFDLDFAEWNSGADASPESGGGPTDVLDDPKYAEAIDFVADQGRASISMIQRRLRIGFNRAARFIEQMEADGIIGPKTKAAITSMDPEWVLARLLLRRARFYGRILIKNPDQGRFFEGWHNRLAHLSDACWQVVEGSINPDYRKVA